MTKNLFSGKCLCIKDIREDFLLGDSGYMNDKISFDILYNFFPINKIFCYTQGIDNYSISVIPEGHTGAVFILGYTKEKFDNSFIDVAQLREERINKIFYGDTIYR